MAYSEVCLLNDHILFKWYSAMKPELKDGKLFRKPESCTGINESLHKCCIH